MIEKSSPISISPEPSSSISLSKSFNSSSVGRKPIALMISPIKKKSQWKTEWKIVLPENKDKKHEEE